MTLFSIKRFRPMKPEAITEEQLRKLYFPLYVQPKWDSIRVVIINGIAKTYSLKPIPNLYVKEKIKELYATMANPPYLMEGELVLKDRRKSFHDNQSAFMTMMGTPDFEIVLFDCLKENVRNVPYYQRLQNVRMLADGFPFLLTKVESVTCNTVAEALIHENYYTSQGFEGIVIKSIYGIYKCGRSTLNEGYCLKLKRFVDAEAYIVKMNPLFVNMNPEEIDHHGMQKRSHSQENKIPIEALGSFTVCGINGKYKNKYFNVGSGFTQEERRRLWADKGLRDSIENKRSPIITYKYSEAGSTDDAPRQPVFKGFRKDV